ncbi:Carbohydrate-binding CenC domain protein [Modestobacter italicus]|uniref:Carbohydrate-binding CenC domain protein n=1 Tax=Modestobacter italicus (strain DSM 44449 / CECT 9708 / BC 501) TaxID=2732864 RepID=I4ER93_MODI5|nr:hypothetical protein [Modestobacter marinus]CCH85906.1 Carbohydrate-binding CenC domain protein [Modestobacter marinus]
MRRAGAVTGAALAVVAVLTALPVDRADAASSMWVAYDGHSINMAPVPAQPVELTAVASSPLTAVSFAVGGTVLGSTTAVTAAEGTWRATATVDLTGRSGLTAVRTRFTSGKVSSTVDKTLRVTPVPASPALTTPSTGAGPDTTGVPAGVRLTPQVGDLTVFKSGTVIDGIDLTGCITIRANDVVIRNSRITCSASATNMVVATSGTYRNLVVEDSELDGAGIVDIGIGWQNYTLRRVEVRGTNDGARAGSNTTVDASWIHAMVRKGDLHPDAVQSTGGANITITGNTLDPRNYGTGDQGNAAIMLGSELRPFYLQDVVVAGNRLSGGNYTVNVRGDATITRVSLDRNTFTADAKYGPVLAPPTVTVTADNVMAETGLPVVVVPTK